MTDPIPAWLATPEDVAALLRARTKDSNGVELGEWTDTTRPTLDEVEQLIALAAQQSVDADGPGDICSRLARAAIGYRAACLVELSYFPEQVRSDRSPYTELKQLLDDAETALDACIAGGSSDGGAGGVGYSYHSLPVTPLTLAQSGADGWRHPEYPATWRDPCAAPTPASPALIDEPEPPREPPIDVVIGHPPLDV